MDETRTATTDATQAARRQKGIGFVPKRDVAAPSSASSCITACETGRDLLATCRGWSALMVSAQNGDRAVYRKLLTEIADLVTCWGHHHGIYGPACEQLVGNVLRTLHRVRHTYQPSRPFKPWLLGVVRYEVGKQGHRIRDCADHF